MKKKILPSVWLLCAACCTAAGQSIRQPVTAVYTRLSGYSTVNNDAFSFTANPAALSGTKAFTAGLYSERRFTLKELALYHAALALPTGSGNFGLAATYFGGQSYNESSAGLAYGRSLGKIDVGARFNYHMLKLAGYGAATAINFEAGALLHATEKLQTGITIYNPLSSKIGKTGEEKLPAIYTAGFGYDASDKFFLGAEVQKTEGRPVNVAAGLQYNITDNVMVRGGVSTATATWYLGAGFWLNGFRVDVTATLHPQLGLTPGVMLVYAKPPAEKE